MLMFALLVVIAIVLLCLGISQRIVTLQGGEKTHTVRSGDHIYRIQTWNTKEDTQRWLKRYSKRGARCARCGALLFYGNPVTKFQGRYYHHGPSYCSPVIGPELPLPVLNKYNYILVAIYPVHEQSRTP